MDRRKLLRRLAAIGLVAPLGAIGPEARAAVTTTGAGKPPGGITPVFKWNGTNGSNGAVPTLDKAASFHIDGSDATHSVNSGDLLLAFLSEVAASGVDPGAITLSGFTQVFQSWSGIVRDALFYKVAGGSEPSSYTPGNWSNTGETKAASLVCFQAGTFNAGAPIYGFTGPNNENYATTVVANAVTLAGSHDLYCVMASADSSSNAQTFAFSTPAGYTGAVNNPLIYGSATSANPLEEVFFKNLPAGAAGPITLNLFDTFGNERRSFSFAIAGA